MQNQLAKAICLDLTGSTSSFEKIEFPIPDLLSTDILVKVKAVSVNPVDIKVLKGFGPSTDQRILGYDASGIVTKIGPSVTRFKVGDEVFYAGNIKKAGSNATYQIVDSRIVGKKPKNMTHAEAAGFPLVSLTAWEGLVDRGGIPVNKEGNKGKSILVVNGGGGVGSMVVQIAKQVLGLTVIATASRKETSNFAIKMGADYVITHKSPLLEQLIGLGISMVDYVFHAHELTNDYVKSLADCTKPFGKVITITMAKSLNLFPFFEKSIDLAIEYMFTSPTTSACLERQGEILDKISQLIEGNVLKCPVTETKNFGIDNLKDMHKKIEDNQAIGKMTLDNVDVF